MNNSPKADVSVVIPLYNKARYIRRAVESVLAQTHRDFELIVVDDGSSDGSAEVVRGIADPRIRLVVQENVGECATRNRGVQEASAEVVALLDADDEWLPDFLETVLALRKKFPEAGVWGTAYVEMKPEGYLRQLQLDEETRRHADGLLINFFRFTLQVQQPFNATSTMVRKDALREAGGFPAGLVRLGDTDTFFRLALRYPTAYCPVAKAIYHMEAEDRTDSYVYSGNFPFFKHAREFLGESPGNRELGEDVRQYLGFYHTGSLYPNWLAGNRAAMREIIRDCRRIKGYRFTCLWWGALAWIPYPLVKLYIKLRSRIARLVGRSGPLPLFRSIYRV